MKVAISVWFFLNISERVLPFDRALELEEARAQGQNAARRDSGTVEFCWRSYVIEVAT